MPGGVRNFAARASRRRSSTFAVRNVSLTSPPGQYDSPPSSAQYCVSWFSSACTRALRSAGANPGSS